MLLGMLLEVELLGHICILQLPLTLEQLLLLLLLLEQPQLFLLLL